MMIKSHWDSNIIIILYLVFLLYRFNYLLLIPYLYMYRDTISTVNQWVVLYFDIVTILLLIALIAYISTSELNNSIWNKIYQLLLLLSLPFSIPIILLLLFQIYIFEKRRTGLFNPRIFTIIIPAYFAYILFFSIFAIGNAFTNVDQEHTYVIEYDILNVHLYDGPGYVYGDIVYFYRDDQINKIVINIKVPDSTVPELNYPYVLMIDSTVVCEGTYDHGSIVYHSEVNNEILLSEIHNLDLVTYSNGHSQWDLNYSSSQDVYKEYFTDFFRGY